MQNSFKVSQRFLKSKNVFCVILLFLKHVSAKIRFFQSYKRSITEIRLSVAELKIGHPNWNPDIFASIFALLDIFGHLMNVPAWLLDWASILSSQAALLLLLCSQAGRHRSVIFGWKWRTGMTTMTTRLTIGGFSDGPADTSRTADE